MKLVLSALCVILACQVAVSNASGDVDLKCATALIQRVKYNVLEQAGDVRQRVIEIKHYYDNCIAIPSQVESYECLRAFALKFIAAGQSLFPEILERRENTTLYALERLLDYHECRLDQTNSVSARDARQTYCALIVIENVQYRFAHWITTAEDTWYRLVYRFLECYHGPEDRQPRCFLSLAEDTSNVIESTIVFLGGQGEYLINSVDFLLNSYHECRLR